MPCCSRGHVGVRGRRGGPQGAIDSEACQEVRAGFSWSDVLPRSFAVVACGVCKGGDLTYIAAGRSMTALQLGFLLFFLTAGATRAPTLPHHDN